VRGNGSHLEVDAQGGTGFPTGPSVGKVKRVSFPGPSSICYLPIGGYLLATDAGARVWYVDDDDLTAPLIFGKPGAHDGDGDWFRAGGRRPKISNTQSVNLTPTGDILLVEGGFVRKIDFLRHKP
jgi:hypothetical protein